MKNPHAVALCLILATPAAAQTSTVVTKKDHTIWASALVLVGAIDLETSHGAFKRGGREGNPWAGAFGESSGIVVMKGLGIAGALASARALRERGHKVWPWVVIGGTVMLYGVAAYSNTKIHEGVAR